MDFYFAFVYGSTYARTFWPLAKFFALIVTSYMHHKSVLTPVFFTDKSRQKATIQRRSPVCSHLGVIH